VVTVSALADVNGLAGGGAAPTCGPDRDDTLATTSNVGVDDPDPVKERLLNLNAL
jgi:subtilisin